MCVVLHKRAEIAASTSCSGVAVRVFESASYIAITSILTSLAAQP